MARARDPDRLEPTVAYVVPWKDHLAGELEAAGVATVCLSTRRRDLRWPLRLRRLMADGGFDVVHSHSPVLAVAAPTGGARPCPPTAVRRSMTTEHNTWGSYRWATRWANRLTSRADAATFAVTEEVRASLRGVAAERAEVLVHGIDVERIAAAAGERATSGRLGLRADELVVGTVANLRAQKDYPTLLAAARLLVDRGVAFRLVAVGQGPLEREITSRRDELGLGDHVVLAGFRPDAVEVMAACDVFVLASAWEGLPVAVMEAAALGLPIVATAVGGVAEQFGPTDALLVPPRDPVALAGALESVLTDPCRRAELASAARSAAPRFDIRRAIETITTRYEQLAGVSPARPSPAPIRRRVDAIDLRPATPDDREQILALLGVSPRMGRRQSLPRAVRVEARAQSVRSVARVGGRARRSRRRRPLVHALDVPAGRVHAARGAGRGHGDAPGPPGTRPVHGADDARRRSVPSRGRGVRVQHPERAEPAGLPQDGLARGRSSPGRRAATRSAATSSPSPEAGSRPSSGRCRSTSAPTSRRGSTRAVVGRRPSPVSSTDRTLRTASDERLRPLALRPGRAALPRHRRSERRRSSCASDVAAPGVELVVADQLGDPDRADGSGGRHAPTGRRDPRLAPGRRERSPWVRERAGGRPDPHVAGRVRPRSAAAAQLGPVPRRPRAVLTLLMASTHRLRPGRCSARTVPR